MLQQCWSPHQPNPSPSAGLGARAIVIIIDRAFVCYCYFGGDGKEFATGARSILRIVLGLRHSRPVEKHEVVSSVLQISFCALVEKN
jgi:hypothetical protein